MLKSVTYKLPLYCKVLTCLLHRYTPVGPIQAQALTRFTVIEMTFIYCALPLFFLYDFMLRCLDTGAILYQYRFHPAKHMPI
jgi:hypothetical protein